MVRVRPEEEKKKKKRKEENIKLVPTTMGFSSSAQLYLFFPLCTAHTQACTHTHAHSQGSSVQVSTVSPKDHGGAFLTLFPFRYFFCLFVFL